VRSSFGAGLGLGGGLAAHLVANRRAKAVAELTLGRGRQAARVALAEFREGVQVRGEAP